MKRIYLRDKARATNPEKGSKNSRGVLTSSQIVAIERVHTLLDELERERSIRGNLQRSQTAARKGEG
jgi:hypothetical protein